VGAKVQRHSESDNLAAKKNFPIPSDNTAEQLYDLAVLHLGFASRIEKKFYYCHSTDFCKHPASRFSI
jgi:hypothetical protein